MQFGAYIVQNLVDAGALKCAALGREPRGFVRVGDILQDRRAFGDDVAAVEFKRRHIAVRIDCQVILAAFGALFCGVDFFDVKGGSGFGERNVGRERAGAGFIIKLHRRVPFLHG